MKAKLVVELQGAVHDTPDAQQYDAKRQEFLEATGFRVLEFTNEEVLRLPHQVQSTLQSLLTPPPASPSPLGEGGPLCGPGGVPHV